MSSFSVKRSLKKPTKAPDSSEPPRPLTQSNLNQNHSIKLFRTKRNIPRATINHNHWQSESALPPQYQTQPSETNNEAEQIIHICRSNQGLRQLIQAQTLPEEAVSRVAQIVRLRLLSLAAHKEEDVVVMLEEGVKKEVSRRRCEERCKAQEGRVGQLINERLEKLGKFVRRGNELN